MISDGDDDEDVIFVSQERAPQPAVAVVDLSLDSPVAHNPPAEAVQNNRRRHGKYICLRVLVFP